MVYAQTVLEGLAKGIYDSGRLPDETTYATLELNGEGAHANVEPPIVELQPLNVERDRSRNTELVGYETDNQGNHVGELYRSWFTVETQLSCISAGGSEYDASELAGQVRDALFRYDNRTMDELLPHPTEGLLDEVTRVTPGDRVMANDFTTTIPTRRSRLTVECDFYHQYSTVDYAGKADPVTTVLTPNDGDTVSNQNGYVDLETSDDL